jgi:hypothetical protein
VSQRKHMPRDQPRLTDRLCPRCGTPLRWLFGAVLACPRIGCRGTAPDSDSFSRSPSFSVCGVFDQIRTALTLLVAEIRARTPDDVAVPSAEAANQAVQVLVRGKRHNINVNAPLAEGESSSATVAIEQGSGDDESPFWTRWRRIGAFVVGAAAVITAVITVLIFWQP